MRKNETKVQDTKVKETKKEKLTEAFVLWKNKSKKGTDYLSGYDLNKNKLIGFFNSNKKNPNEPDIRVYEKDENGKQTEKTVAGLWSKVSKAGATYFTGTTDEKEKLVVFISNDENSKKPYIKAYFDDEIKEETEVI